MQHSNIVGGSTAKRVISCPGSVALVKRMPPQASSTYADKGTLLHNAISEVLLDRPNVVGSVYKDQTLTQELYDEKIVPALAALEEIDPDDKMVYEVETRVGFGALLPGVFGSTDFVGRIGKRAVVLDWKFGDGIVVAAEENAQLMFYAAAAMRTKSLDWAFDDCEEIECVIVQPPMIRRWVTTPERIAQFERELVKAVLVAQEDNAPLASGDHCRWCAAKPVCPQITGAVDRALKTTLDSLDVVTMSQMLQSADLLEQWLKDIRGLAHQVLDKGGTVPGFKLVAKRGTRQWAKEDDVVHWLDGKGLEPKDIYSKELLSPAQMEKVLKKRKLALPDDLVVSVSSGATLAPESDPRPAMQSFVGLSKALSKLE